jgi:uncharacterized protein (DUF1501 family)
MDGLNALVPGADANYATRRANIAIPTGQLIPVDRTFGLHPAYAPLTPLLSAGKIAAVPAAGLVGNVRSHFEDTTTMEIAGAAEGTGYLARLLTVLPTGAPFRGFQEGETTAQFFLGSSTALAVTGIDNFRPAYWGAGVEEANRPTALTALFSGAAADHPYGVGLRTTLDALTQAEQLAKIPYSPAAGATYPAGDLGNAFKDVARMIKIGAGVRLAAIDDIGYDTHGAQGGLTGALASLQARHSAAIAAFFTDLGALASNVMVVTTQEFGRRVDANGDGGTDHGAGGVMFVIGAGAVGGVHGGWHGLAADQLDNNCVPVLTDYRDVLGEAFLWLGLSQGQLTTVFPGLGFNSVGAIATA